MTMIADTTPLIEKARAGRRAALTSLHARLGHADKVVSIFENAFPARVTELEFRSVRVARRRPATIPAGRAAA